MPAHREQAKKYRESVGCGVRYTMGFLGPYVKHSLAYRGVKLIDRRDLF